MASSKTSSTLLTLSTAILLLFSSSCKEGDTRNGGGPTSPALSSSMSKITTIEQDVYSCHGHDFSDFYSFTYDKNGRLSHIKAKEDYYLSQTLRSEELEVRYQYDGGTIEVLYKDEESEYKPVKGASSFSVDSSGRVTLIAGILECIYENGHLVTFKDKSSGDYPDDDYNVDLKWEGDLLTQKTEKLIFYESENPQRIERSELTEEKWEYSPYDNDCNIMFPWDGRFFEPIRCVIPTGWFGRPIAKLPSKIKGTFTTVDYNGKKRVKSYTITYKYLLDAKKRPIFIESHEEATSSDSNVTICPTDNDIRITYYD